MKKLIFMCIVLLLPYLCSAVRPLESGWKVVTADFIKKVKDNDSKIQEKSITLATASAQTDSLSPDTIGIIVTNNKSKISRSAVSDPGNAFYQSFQNFLVAAGPNIPLTKEQNKKIQSQKIQFLRLNQLEKIKNIFNNALLVTYDIELPKSFTSLINAINGTFKQNGIGPRIVILAYGENAPLVNQALRLVKKEYPINLLIYLQSPIYEYAWDPLRGYTNVVEETPSNFFKLVNIYTKMESPVNLRYSPMYPDRKYRATVSLSGQTLKSNVYNVNAVKINSQGQIEQLKTSDFASNLFVSNLAWLLEQIKTYQLNFDLMAQLWNEEKQNREKKGSVFINRFVDLVDGKLVIQYGDSYSQRYILNSTQITPEVLNAIKNQFTKELNQSWSQLRNIFDVSATEGVSLRYFGSSKMASDLARIKDQHIQNFNSPLYLQKYQSDILLDNKKSELQKLLSLLDNPVSFSYAVQKIVMGGSYIFELIFKNSMENIPNKSQDDYLQSIVAMMWYLYSQAISKDQGFTEGAFVIEDKDFKIYNFLMGYVKKVNPSITGTIKDKARTSADNPFAYSRVSSHYKLEQKTHRQYGIDIRLDKNSEALPLLPIGKRHLVFGIIDQARNLIYLKPENYGIYSFYEKAMHGKEFIVARGVKLLPSMKNILSDPLYKSFEEYIGTDDDPLYRKERVPQEFIVEFEKIINQQCRSKKNAQKIIREAIQKGIKRVFAIKPAIIMADLRQQLDAQFDYLYYRTGREIILTHDELIDSLYYYLIVLDHSDALKAKKIFNSIIEIKNLSVELKKEKLKQNIAVTEPPINDILKQIRELAQELTSIDPTFLQQWSEVVYQKVIRIQRIVNSLQNEKDQIVFADLTTLGSLFDSRFWKNN